MTPIMNINQKSWFFEYSEVFYSTLSVNCCNWNSKINLSTIIHIFIPGNTNQAKSLEVRTRNKRNT